jgi:excisionase family DNA binding protein
LNRRPLELAPALLRLDAAAAYLDVSRSTVNRLTEQGILPHVMVATERRWSVAALDEWVKAHLVYAEPQESLQTPKTARIPRRAATQPPRQRNRNPHTPIAV